MNNPGQQAFYIPDSGSHVYRPAGRNELLKHHAEEEKLDHAVV
jgi:hypothetical protein